LVAKARREPAPLASSPSPRNMPMHPLEGSGSCPPWLSKNGVRRQQTKEQRRRWMAAEGRTKKAKKAKTQMVCRGYTEPQASHLYPDGRPTGGQKGRNSFRIQ
jgi:hypothetical protein